MSLKYEKWKSRADDIRTELQNSIVRHGGNDIIFNYHDIAFAFPSSSPNPKSFEYPLIDEEEFFEWCEINKWKYKLDHSDQHESIHAPVRLTKI